jgi:hypothetical protein
MLLNSSKRITAILKGLKNKHVTQPFDDKKYYKKTYKDKTWKPLLLRDTMVSQAESNDQLAKKYVFERSAVDRYWDKAKAREMVSSGPLLIKDQVNVEELVNKTLMSVLLIQRGFRRLVMKKRLKAMVGQKAEMQKYLKYRSSAPLLAVVNAPSVKKAMSTKLGKRLIITEKSRTVSISAKPSSTRIIPSISSATIKTQCSNGQGGEISRRSTGTNIVLLNNLK